MAGLFAWAADVVGGGGQGDEEDEGDGVPLAFSPEQQSYVWELNRKATSLSRAIQDLRLRIPPPDISQRLPHIHAHSLASNAALTLQLNSHSATREQAQSREISLKEENDAFRKAISDCESKIQEKLVEANLLQRKLEAMDATEENLKVELENAQSALDKTQSETSGGLTVGSEARRACADAEALQSDILDKLEGKKKELFSLDEAVQNLEKTWVRVQESALKQPTPAQREKTLDKQLHSLIEQLAAKQDQAEGLASEVHLKEMELERLNRLRLERCNAEMNAARNRFGRSGNMKGSVSSDCIAEPQQRRAPYSENQKRLMLLRSVFVLYILALHVLVFLKISF